MTDAEKGSRFVVVDGVQVNRVRAERLGLVPDEKSGDERRSTARSADSVRTSNAPAPQVQASAVADGQEVAGAADVVAAAGGTVEAGATADAVPAVSGAAPDAAASTGDASTSTEALPPVTAPVSAKPTTKRK